jgi:hypothetical protein
LNPSGEMVNVYTSRPIVNSRFNALSSFVVIATSDRLLLAQFDGSTWSASFRSEARNLLFACNWFRSEAGFSLRFK